MAEYGIDQSFCVYCGAIPQSCDHFIPGSNRDRDQARITNRDQQLIVGVL